MQMAFDRSHILLPLAFAVLVGACASTRDADKSAESHFLGKPSDAFFSQFGPPQSSFKLNDGGTVYTWVGGQSTVTVPPVYTTVTPPMAGTGFGQTQTTTHVSNPSPGTTVTTTRSHSFSIGVPTTQQVVVTPAQTIQVFCAAQITTDAKGNITHIHATQDTRGAGMSMSRCAEVFGVR